MTETKTRVQRLVAPGSDEAIYADDYGEPGEVVSTIDSVVGFDPDRRVWLVFSKDNKLIEVSERSGSDAWDYLNKFWSPVPDTEESDEGYWNGCPDAIGKWLRGEV